MGLIELSNNDKDKLLQLSITLEEIRVRKQQIIEKIEPYYNRMNEIIDAEKSLEENYEQIFADKDNVEFKSELDANKLSDIISKQKDLEEEKFNIDLISRDFYEQLNEILLQEDEIVSKIKNLANESFKSKEEEKMGIYIDSLNTFVQISDIPVNNYYVINREYDEIIRTNENTMSEISQYYSKNTTNVEDTEDMSYYEKLEKIYLENKIEEKDNSNTSEISFLTKDDEKQDTTEVNDELPNDLNLENNVSLDNDAVADSQVQIDQEPINTLDRQVQENKVNLDNNIVENSLAQVNPEPILNPLDRQLEESNVNLGNNIVENSPAQVNSEPILNPLDKQLPENNANLGNNGMQEDPLLKDYINQGQPQINLEVNNQPQMNMENSSVDSNVLSLDSILSGTASNMQDSSLDKVKKIYTKGKYDKKFKVANTNRKKLKNIIDNFNDNSTVVENIVTFAKPDSIESFLNAQKAA